MSPDFFVSQDIYCFFCLPVFLIANLIYSSIFIIKILSYSKRMPKKDTNWNTAKLRTFDLQNYNLSIDPSYTGKDVVNIKAKSQHFHTKLPVFRKKTRTIG